MAEAAEAVGPEATQQVEMEQQETPEYFTSFGLPRMLTKHLLESFHS